jgi:hypothetical protein
MIWIWDHDGEIFFFHKKENAFNSFNEYLSRTCKKKMK